MTGTASGNGDRQSYPADCAVAEDLIESVLDGECSPELVASVEEHLDTCLVCRERFDNVRALKQAVRSACLGEIAPETVRVRVAELHVSWRSTIVQRPGA